MARKGDLKDLREPNTLFFVLMYKDTLLSTINLPLYQVLFLMFYRTIKMYLQVRYHQGYNQREVFSTKSTLFLVPLFQIDHHIVPSWRKQKKFSNKSRNLLTRAM